MQKIKTFFVVLLLAFSISNVKAATLQQVVSDVVSDGYVVYAAFATGNFWMVSTDRGNVIVTPDTEL